MILRYISSLLSFKKGPQAGAVMLNRYDQSDCALIYQYRRISGVGL